jgi:hypothetical protein
MTGVAGMNPITNLVLVTKGIVTQPTDGSYSLKIVMITIIALRTIVTHLQKMYANIKLFVVTTIILVPLTLVILPGAVLITGM